MLDKEANELIGSVIKGRQIFHPVGAFIIFDHDRADIVEELVYTTTVAALIPGSGRTGIGSLDHLLIGKDEAHAVSYGIDQIAPEWTRPAGVVIAVSPASGGIGELNQIVKVNVGNSHGITGTDVQGRQVELVGVWYADRYSLFDVLNKVAQYPDRQVTRSKAIVVSEIGEQRE